MLIPSMVSIVFWVFGVLFYLIRKINKASVNLKDKSISIENSNEKSNEKG